MMGHPSLRKIALTALLAAALFGMAVAIGAGLRLAADRSPNPLVGLLALMRGANYSGRAAGSPLPWIAQAPELQGANQAQRSVLKKLAAFQAAEQAALARQIEGEKNQDRRSFNQTLERQITQALVAAPGARRIFKDLRLGLDGLRQALAEIQSVQWRGAADGELLDPLAERLARLALVQAEVRRLGSGLGGEIDRALDGVQTLTAEAARGTDHALGAALEEAGRLDGAVALYEAQQRSPVVALEPGRPPTDPHPAQDATTAAAQALASAAQMRGLLGGTGMTRAELRERIRLQLLQQPLRLLKPPPHPGEAIRQVICSGAGEGAYAAGMLELGLTPEKAAQPQSARYLVCTERTLGQTIFAVLIGPARPPAQGQ